MDETFIPCTAAGSTCEIQPSYFFGVAGVCNVTTGLCMCPDGFTGIDDVARYNDCHISVSFRAVCHTISLILISLAAVVSIAGLIKLNIMWGVLSWAKDSEAGRANMAGFERDRSEAKTRDMSTNQPHLRSPRLTQPGPLLAMNNNNHNNPQVNNTYSSSAHTSGTMQTSLPVHSPDSPTSVSRALPPPRSASSGQSGGSPRKSKSYSKNATAPLQMLQSVALTKERKTDGNQSDSQEDERSDDGMTEVVKRKKSRAPRLSIKPMQQPKTNVRSASFYHDVSLAKRRRNTCLLMSGFALHAIFGVAAFSCFSGFMYMAEKNAGLLLSLSCSLSCFQWSIWVLAYSWCGSLQSMKGYARMFPNFASHPLMRFPWLASTITSLCLLLATIFCVTFFLALPLTVDAKALTEWVVPVALTSIALMMMLLTIFQSVVFSLLLRMFAMYTGGSAGPVGGSQVSRIGGTATGRGSATDFLNEARGSAFVKARKTVLLVLIMGVIFGPFVAFLVLIGAWTAEGRRHMYFFFSAMFALTAVAVLSSSYVIVYRISSSAGNQFSNQMSPVTKSRKNGSKLASSQQGNVPSEMSPPGPNGKNTGPLMLAMRNPAKGSSDVQLS